MAGRRCWPALAVVLAVAAGCSERTPAQPAVVPDTPENVSTWGFTPAADEVVVIGSAPLRVLRPVRLEAARFEVTEGEIDVLAARVSLFACPSCRARPSFMGYPGYAGSACSTAPWPPPGYGPSYPIEGFELAPGDRPSILLYFRAGTAEAATGAIALTYTEAGDRHDVSIRNERVKISHEDPVPDHCPDSLWFGGKDNPDADRVRELTASPTP